MDATYRRYVATALLLGAMIGARKVNAQTFGVELHNTLMPAAGGMGGVSIAQPQDLTSAINGNPAAVTQFEGTQFLFGGTGPSRHSTSPKQATFPLSLHHGLNATRLNRRRPVRQQAILA